MSDFTSNATVELFVNGEQPAQQLERLKQKQKELTKAIEETKNVSEYKKLNRELDKVDKQISRMSSAAKGVGIVMNDLSGTSITGLKNTLKQLRAELNATKPDTKRWNELAEQISNVKSRISDLNDRMGENKSVWRKFKDWAEDTWPAIDLLSRGYQSAISGLRGYVDAYASMDQEMANVRKFTGMSADQVTALNEELKKIDTRTSREDLNKLAQEAGRLGKSSQEDVLGFVRAADKINVALDDLGDGATLTLSKLTGIFGDEAKYGTEQSLLKVGSVINELSQNCSASAPYIAEFASRMGGVGAQAGLTVSQIMGFAAVLDSNNQALEASSTALSQVIVRMMQDPAKYAKVAGLDIKNFTNLLRTDVNSALILFLETLSKAGGMDNLSPMFADMGENGARAIQALSTLASHIDQVKEQQKAANTAFEEGISIDNEFDVQNNTVQASLDKCKNAAHELQVELGERLYPLMGHLLTSAAAIIRVLNSTIGFLSEHKRVVMALSAAVAGYILASKSMMIILKAYNALKSIDIALTKAQAIASSNLSIVTKALQLAYFKLTGQMQKATIAQRSLKMAMASTPWGAVATAIAAGVAAFSMFKDEVNETTETTDALTQATIDAKAKLADEEYQLQQNITAVKDFNGTKDQEQTLIAQLNEKYGPILGTYSTLSDWLRVLTTRGYEYCEAIHAQIVMEGKLEQARLLIAKAAKLRTEGDGTSGDIGTSIAELLAENFKRMWNADWGVLTNPTDFDDINNRKVEAYWERMYAMAAEAEAKAEELRKSAAEDAKLYGIKFTPDDLSDYTPPLTPTPTPTPYEPKKLKKKEEREAKAAARAAALAEKRRIAMEKKEVKDALESAKGDWEFGSAENTMNYGLGLKSYEEYLNEKDRLDLKYATDRMAIYDKLYESESAQDKKILLMFDEDYQNLLKQHAELILKQKNETASRRIEELQQEYDDLVNQLEIEYSTPNSSLYDNDAELQRRMYQLRIEYLLKYKNQYERNSKEWIEYDRQITEAENQNKLERRQLFAQKYKEWLSKYEYQSAKERYSREVEIAKQALMAGVMSLDDFSMALKVLKEKYSTELLPESSKDSKDSKSEAAKAKEEDLNIIKSLEEQGLISHEEAEKRKANITRYYATEATRNAIDCARSIGSEHANMLIDVYDAWKKFFENSSEDGSNWATRLGDAASAAFALMNAGMQSYSEYAQACTALEIARTEKRYDREIQLAQKNSYRTKQLEKQKERDLAKIKADANRKQFTIQVIQAIAQTATNAISAYGAALKIGPAGLVLAPIAAAMAVAQGLMQIATLKKQQQASEAQGYSKGGFTKKGAVDEPAGIVHAGEWVASQKLLANPIARPMIEALDYAQRTNTIGSLRPDDISRSIRANDALSRLAENDGSTALVVAAVAQNAVAVSALTKRLNEPFVTVNTVTGDAGIKKAQDEYSRMIKNVTPKSKRK